MSAHAYISGHTDPAPGQTLTSSVVFSALSHGLLVAALIFWSGQPAHEQRIVPVIHVNMVSLPQATDAGPEPTRRAAVQTPPAKAPEPAPEPAPAPEPVSTKPLKSPAPSKAAVSLSKKRVKRKTSLKKKTYRPAQAVRKAIRRIEKNVDAGRPDPIATAMDRLRAKVAAEPPRAPAAGRGPSKAVSSGSRVGFSSGEAAAQKALALIDIYRVEIAFQIQKNWAFSGSLAGSRHDLSAELAFTVLPDGHIQDVWFDKRSGNRYLDESARKAIFKSDPVPPHPAGILRPYITVGLRFTPEGVSR